MEGYFRIYMQKEGDGEPIKDTIADFGMYVSENPFKPCEAVKEPPKVVWNDQNGDDEYIGKDGLYMASYENKIKFVFNSKAFGANEKCKSFTEYLRKSGKLKMYCEFNQIGRQHVRLKSISPDLYRDPGDEDLLTMSVTFKFNDPVTDIKPVYGADGVITNLVK